MVPSELPTESVSGRKNAGMIGPVKRRRDSFLKNLVPGVLSPILNRFGRGGPKRGSVRVAVIRPESGSASFENPAWHVARREW